MKLDQLIEASINTPALEAAWAFETRYVAKVASKILGIMRLEAKQKIEQDPTYISRYNYKNFEDYFVNGYCKEGWVDMSVDKFADLVKAYIIKHGVE